MNRIPIPDLGIEIMDTTVPAALAELAATLHDFSIPRFVVFFEANLLSLVIRDAEVRKCVQEADWVFPDGIAVSKLSGFYAGHTVERVSGPSFFLKACEYGQSQNWKHFFYGGTPESMEKLLVNLRRRYPGLQVAGYYTPPFRSLTEAEDAEVRRRIESSGADFLWVGLGGPKQEQWIRSHRHSIRVPVMLGIGAAFDFHSGTRPWAPPLIRFLGLEWLFRAFFGGGRMLRRNFRCVAVVFFYLVRKRIRLWINKRLK